MKIILLCLPNVAMLASGQMLFKLGVENRNLDRASEMLKAVFSPIILASLALYALTTILWLYILNKASLSLVYPIQALSYPTVMLLSILFFKESVSAMQWAGVAIICIGVSLIVKSS